MMTKRFPALVFFVCFLVVLKSAMVGADDTCVFTVDISDDAKPNVVLLLDNGAEIENVVWHDDFNKNTDYTPVADEPSQFDVVGSLPVSTNAGYIKLTSIASPDSFTKNKPITNSAGETIATTIGDATFWDSSSKIMYFTNKDSYAATFAVGQTIYNTGGSAIITAINWGGYNGFYNKYGYSFDLSGSVPLLVKVLPDLNLAATGYPANADSYSSSNKTATWTINGRTLTLPVLPDGDGAHAAGILDNATHFRYSTNYLNWIFFAKDAGSQWLYDGSGLERVSRLYVAKMAMAAVAKKSENKIRIGLYLFNSDAGATQQAPLLDVLQENGELTSSFYNALSTTHSNTYSPLAEGLMSVGGYYDKELAASADPTDPAVCQKNFILLITPGISSKDEAALTGGSQGCMTGTVHPDCLGDYDGDLGLGGVLDAYNREYGKIKVDYSQDEIDNDLDGTIDEADEVDVFDIPINIEGTTNADDIAHYLYVNDIRTEVLGHQNISTYTVGFGSSEESNRFLINISNNGNGKQNLYDVHDPDYGKFNFEAKTSDELAAALEEALATIIERTNAFAAPVVPITRTTSGDRLYMSFFTPKEKGQWVGNVVKYGLNEYNQLLDKYGNLATNDSGVIKETAEPFWQTVNWAADATTAYPQDNGMHNTLRNIYTYLGTDVDLTVADNAFKDNNTLFNDEVLGYPDTSKVTLAEIINYVRGADTFDENEDGDKTQNRSVITADVLHSEPLAYEYLYTSGTLLLDPATVSGDFEAGEDLIGSTGGVAVSASVLGGTIVGDPDLYPWSVATESYRTLQYRTMSTPFEIGEVVQGASSGASGTVMASSNKSMIFFGANDGMLHAVKDTDGKEAWGFVPPDQLSRLKDMILGTGHQDYVDSSPKVYLKDLNGDGFITDVDEDGVWEDTDDQVILVCGERKGGRSYFALDVTSPNNPKYLWRLSGATGPAFDDKVAVDADLGETWSEPSFGKIKNTEADTVGIPVMIVGGGYTEDDSAGMSLMIVNVLTGTVEKTFKNGGGNGLSVFDDASMNYPLAATVTILDINYNRFIDTIYAVDVGGQVWRFGNFTESDGITLLPFRQVNEDFHTWIGQRIFVAGCGEDDCTDNKDNNTNLLIDEKRTFFYPPVVAPERGYDIVFIGSGDRENPCAGNINDRVYAIKDTHATLSAPLTESDLSDNTVCPTVFDMDDDDVDGWYYGLPVGQKVLSEVLLFNKILIVNTYITSTDACAPGGYAYQYYFEYKSGCGAVDLDNDGIKDVSKLMGIGIPSKSVLVINDSGKVDIFTTYSGGVPSEDGEDGIKLGGSGDLPNLTVYKENWWKEL